MSEAYYKLKNDGEKAFQLYCDRVCMPESDREAVLNKDKRNIKSLIGGIGETP